MILFNFPPKLDSLIQKEIDTLTTFNVACINYQQLPVNVGALSKLDQAEK